MQASETDRADGDREPERNGAHGRAKADNPADLLSAPAHAALPVVALKMATARS